MSNFAITILNTVCILFAQCSNIVQKLFKYCFITVSKFCKISIYCFQYCLNTVLQNSEILSSFLSPLPPLHVNMFQILFALLFVRGVFVLLQMIAQTFICGSSRRLSLFYYIACVRTCQKLPCTGSGRSDLIAHRTVRP